MRGAPRAPCGRRRLLCFRGPAIGRWRSTGKEDGWLSGPAMRRPHRGRLMLVSAVLVAAAGGGLGMAAWAAGSIPGAAGESAAAAPAVPADVAVATAPSPPAAPETAPAAASSVHYASL